MTVTVAKGQTTLFDMNDVISSPTQPTGTFSNGALWSNTTDNQLYVYYNGNWMVSTQGLIVGGSNLLNGTKDMTGNYNYSYNTANNYNGFTIATSTAPASGYNDVFNQTTPVLTELVYTVSFYAMSTNATQAINCFFYNPNTTTSAVSSTGQTSTSVDGSCVVYVTNTWKRYWVTWKQSSSGNAKSVIVGRVSNGGNVSIAGVQFEKGNTATDWSPSASDTQTQINTVNNYLNDLADDSKISRFERSVVRQMVNDITGLWLNPTDSMPTLATIDSSGIGSLYSLRKAARDIGADTTPGTNYTNVGTAYTALANYLNSLSPKPWDTTLTTTGSTSVTPATWNADWKSYNDSLNLLQIDVQDRQKAYADAAQQNAINAVQNSVAHSTVNIANPSFSINAPIATLGLPEFQGAHADSWYIGGRNLLLDSSLLSDSGLFSANQNVTLSNPGGNYLQVYSNQSTSTPGIVINPYNNLANGTYTVSMDIAGIGGTTSVSLALRGPAKSISVTSSFTRQSITLTADSSVAYFLIYITCTAVGQGFQIKNVKVESGSTANVYTPAPEDIWGTNGNRIKPITNPTFLTGTSLTMNIGLYGNGTANDSVVWDSNGNLVKTRKWQDDNLDGAENWVFGTDATGYKQVKVPAYAVDVTNNTVQAVKHNGTLLSTVTSFTAADQVALASADNTLYISIADTDSGWGESYTPTSQEIDAYFLGWRMCNGTYNTNYTAKREVDTLTITHAATATGNIVIGLNGTNYTISVANGDSTTTIASKIAAATFTGYTDSASSSVVTFTATQDITVPPTFSGGTTGVTATLSTTAGDIKKWYPIGDTDTSRITSFVNGVPTTVSPAIGTNKNYYQVIYQVGTPTQVTGYTFDGVLALIQGSNTVKVSYPSYTPSIVTGTVKYATNLATTTQDLSYIIPTIQTRLASAESKVTNDAIVNTVTKSVSYQTALAGKADSSSLSNYATQAALNNTNSNVTNLSGTVNGISGQLSTFVTTTQETADIKGVKESFYQSGGMNLVYNSVGYDYNTSTKAINFWTQYSAYNVTTIQNNDLYNLGFGSGFYFAPNGQNKGITQDINVVPGQHYTLSWYLNKLTSGGDGTFRFYIQIMENGVVVQQLADNSGTKTNGYQSSYMQYTASTNVTKCTIRFIAYSNVEAYISGIMFTIGDSPIPWTLATGESYNTNIRMNINGIVVSQLDANGNETGYTQITPSEFAGYHTSNNGGTFEKVFYLNGDETVTKKITATAAITMGNIQVLPISGASNTGWVFIPNN